MCEHFVLTQSISGFFWLPTMATPRCRRAWGSEGRTIEGRGSMGLSGFTCTASRAACSIASISSLHPAWSKGQTTIGCRIRISRADVRWACTPVRRVFWLQIEGRLP